MTPGSRGPNRRLTKSPKVLARRCGVPIEPMGRKTRRGTTCASPANEKVAGRLYCTVHARWKREGRKFWAEPD